MEFPDLGIQCFVENCKLNDFLPTPCFYCAGIYCKSHFDVLSHNCARNPDNIINEPINSYNNYFICSVGTCKTTSPINMNCPHCHKHFCLSHRLHGCFEKSEREIAMELNNWHRSEEEFAIAKNAIDAQINVKFQRSRNTTMVNKLQLMRIKGRAVGNKAIPMADRRYFFVYPPVQPTGKFHPLAVFVSNTWTLGKAVDVMADSLGLRNSNNIPNSIKLRLFYHDTGELITDEMDRMLSDFYVTGQIYDGLSVILEYSNEKRVECSLY